MRSASFRCAIEMIAIRGLPSASYSSDWMSRASPASQASNPGDASRPLMRSASSVRSFAGKKLSTSKTPILSNGGFCTERISAARSRLSPWRQAASSKADSRMNSRLRIGSASTPSRPSRPATAEPTRSLNAVASLAITGSGAANERRIDNGRPAFEPGV